MALCNAVHTIFSQSKWRIHAYMDVSTRALGRDEDDKTIASRLTGQTPHFPSKKSSVIYHSQTLFSHVNTNNPLKIDRNLYGAEKSATY
jgi:hypothetical protein